MIGTMSAVRVAVLLLLGLGFRATADITRLDLDSSGAGYPVYRIPALAVTKAGTLLAAYDARPSMNDLPSSIAIVLRRSVDGGGSWGERQIVRSGSATEGFGDPSLLVDRTTGRIFLFYAAAVHQGYFGSKMGTALDDPDILQADLSWSDDDGISWRHRRLTSELKNPAWGGLFASSGAGIQLRHGPHAGRLIQQYAIRYQGANYAASAYSDDHGATWRMGALAGPGLDENRTVELADGSVMLNSRARPYRKVAISTDGGLTYTGLHADRALVDPGNNGSIIRYDADAPPDDPRAHWLLFSNTADTSDRKDLTVRLSCDDGRTWLVRRTVEPGAAAYSSLAKLQNGAVGLLYERGDYQHITFAKFDLAWLDRCGDTSVPPPPSPGTQDR
ncbi:MAG: exo-alpha-sialidase [Gemmatimonadales bacterium]